MALSTSTIRLSPLEAFMPRAYVRQIYCFPTSNPHAVDILRRGVATLVREIPYILSRVITEESGFVTVSDPCQRPEDIFSCRDLSASINYASMKVENFPPAAFLHPELIPSESVPPLPDQPSVFLARASLVEGGLLLCVAVHHCVTDITGLGALLKVWASCCRGEVPADTIEFSKDWMDRSPLFTSSSVDALTVSGSADEMPDLLHMKVEEDKKKTAHLQGDGEGPQESGISPVKQGSYYQTAIFYFPQHHLKRLKSAVNAHLLKSLGPGAWVSTGDILCSLLWRAVAIDAVVATEKEGQTEAAIKREEDLEKSCCSSTLSFPVQFRSLLRPERLPADFLGAAFVMTSANVTQGELRRLLITDARTEVSATTTATATATADSSSVDIPALANTALAVRRSIQDVDDAAVRRVLRYLETHPPYRYTAAVTTSRGDTKNDNGKNKTSPARLVLGRPRTTTTRASGNTCNPDTSNTGVTVVSWADQSIYELSWGFGVNAVDDKLFGDKCEAVRLPKIAGKRDPIILPRRRGSGDDGGYEVIMSYEEDVMKRLIQGATMRTFAVLRCLS